MIAENACCFTGHRPNRLPWGHDENDPRCVILKRNLAQAVLDAYESGHTHFICGMALGCDFYFAEAVLALRETHPEVTLEAAIPCPEQTQRWKNIDQKRHETILSQCNYETMVQHRYTPYCMQRRDRYMVDNAKSIIAIYDGISPGGTLYTLTYALRHGLASTILALED